MDEFILCSICKYKNEECDGVHCGHCGRYDFEEFKIDYVTQIAKDFKCSKRVAKNMYHSMIVTYRNNKRFEEG